MISGIVMVLAIIWVYQTALKEKTDNLMLWVGLSAVAFLAVVVLFYFIDVATLETFRASESTEGYERDLMSVGDRKNEGGFEGARGVFLSTFFELMPAVAGFLAVAFIRTKFILKAALTPANLFSGLTEMFASIGNSFKTTATKEEE
jgi:hypothetical protein